MLSKMISTEGYPAKSMAGYPAKSASCSTLPVRDAVEDDTTVGAPVGLPLAGGQMGQLVLVQLSVKPLQIVK